LFSGAFGALSRALKKNKNEEEQQAKSTTTEQEKKKNILTVGKRQFSTKDPSLDGTKWKDFSTLERYLQRRDDDSKSGETSSSVTQQCGIEAELVVPMLVLEGEISFHSKYFEYRPRRVVKDDRCDAVKVRPLSVMLCLRNGMRRWRYDQIRRVLSRRFMLQRTALEVFFLDGMWCLSARVGLRRSLPPVCSRKITRSRISYNSISNIVQLTLEYHTTHSRISLRNTKLALLRVLEQHRYECVSESARHGKCTSSSRKSLETRHVLSVSS